MVSKGGCSRGLCPAVLLKEADSPVGATDPPWFALTQPLVAPLLCGRLLGGRLSTPARGGSLPFDGPSLAGRTL